MIPLSGGSLVDFCAEPGDIKSILALQTSLDASSLPLVPPPSTTTAPSRTTRRSLERDAAAGVGGTAYRQPSETASSISDQVIGENEYFGTVHRGPASETSMSEDATATTTGEVGSTVGGGGGGGGGGTGVRPSIVRKPHTRRMSGVGIGGHCAPSPGTGSRRGTRTSSSSNNSNSGAGNTGAPQSARSPEISSPPAIVGIPEASSDSSSPPLRASRIGNVMPTFLPQATAFSLNSPPPEWSESPPSTSPRQSLSSSDAPAAARSALRHLTSAEEEEEKEEMERAFLQSEREQWLASEDAENERKAREAALEWERKDREEEEERKRRQIEADHEAAMREQRREQDLWVVSRNSVKREGSFEPADDTFARNRCPSSRSQHDEQRNNRFACRFSSRRLGLLSSNSSSNSNAPRRQPLLPPLDLSRRHREWRWTSLVVSPTGPAALVVEEDRTLGRSPSAVVAARPSRALLLRALADDLRSGSPFTRLAPTKRQHASKVQIQVARPSRPRSRRCTRGKTHRTR